MAATDVWGYGVGGGHTDHRAPSAHQLPDLWLNQTGAECANCTPAGFDPIGNDSTDSNATISWYDENLVFTTLTSTVLGVLILATIIGKFVVFFHSMRADYSLQ